jgi:hypothetical protein
MQATHAGARHIARSEQSEKENLFFQCLPHNVEREQCDGNGGTSWRCMLRQQIIGMFLVSVMGLLPATSDIHAAPFSLRTKYTNAPTMRKLNNTPMIFHRITGRDTINNP